MAKINEWYKSGLFYEKYEVTEKNGIYYIKKFRIFCVVFWILVLIFPEKYL